MQCNLKKKTNIDENFSICESCSQTLSKSTLTDYRDSEAQTIPWESRITSESTAAILSLTSLTWNHGLPAGITELKIIKKNDIKKEWKQVLPPLDCKKNFQRYKSIITEIDKDKWTFRNQELQLIADSKLEWIDKTIKLKNGEQRKKLMRRFEKFDKYLSCLRNKEMNQIKFELNRELRKVGAKHREKDLQQILLKKKHNLLIPPTKCSKACSRETKWTEDKLKTLHIDLKRIRLNAISNKINCL